MLGDLDRIVPRSEGLPTGPRRDDVLRVAVDACLHRPAPEGGAAVSGPARGRAETAGPRRVILHVGAPKTGTSYVQDVLYLNRESLAEQGILYPADRFDEHFLAALDLMELHWGGLEAQAVGAWDRLAERVRAWPGTSIVSHEILATATRSAGPPRPRLGRGRRGARRAVGPRPGPADPGRVAGERQAPSHGRLPASSWTGSPTRPGPGSSRPGSGACRRCPTSSTAGAARCLPTGCTSSRSPSREPRATCSGSGSPRSLGLEGVDLELETDRANPSLGVPETVLVQRINQRVNGGVLAGEDYRQFVRELLAHRTLSRRTGSPRLGLPDDVRAWAVDLSETWIEELQARKYDVAGVARRAPARRRRHRRSPTPTIRTRRPSARPRPSRS